MSTKIAVTLQITRAGHKRTEQWTWETSGLVDEDELVSLTGAHALLLEAGDEAHALLLMGQDDA